MNKDEEESVSIQMKVKILMKGIGIVLIMCMFASASLAAEIDRFYVSPSGNDNWSGRTAKPDRRKNDGPFATIKQAQQAVRGIAAGGLKRPVEVVISPGTYHLEEPLVFTYEDSGTESCPITYRAARPGSVIISGGREIRGWKQKDITLWSADIPEAREGRLNFKLLRVGNKWAVRARYPNLDRKDPVKSGWLFAQYHGKPWEQGVFGQAVANVHNAGDRLFWTIEVPADGNYRVWVRYSSKMKDFEVEDMAGRTQLSVDDSAPVPLKNLPDTGGWGTYRWSHSADVQLTSGKHTLTWTNKDGGGLCLDAFALCDDEAWNPEQAIGNFQWWGAFDVKQPAEGKSLVLIQAEACDKAEGKEIKVPKPTPPGGTAFIKFSEGSIPKWKDVKGSEVHIFPAWGWVNGIIPIDKIDYEAGKIILEGGSAQDIRMGNRFFIENVREALDVPGEWYLDTLQGRVLYIPELVHQAQINETSDDTVPFDFIPEIKRVPDVMLYSVKAPVVDRLVELKGDQESGKYVEHINFSGLVFTDTDYTITTDYYSASDAAVWASYTRHCTIDNCEFRWLGGYALHLLKDSNNIAFTGNYIHDMGQGGVIMTGDNTNQPHHNLIAGNRMERLGLIYKHVAGVYVTTGSDNTIIHNTITDTSRYGISLKSYGESHSSHRNTVEYNLIRRCNLETNDTGAIETLGRDKKNTGNIIRYNAIFDSVGVATSRDGGWRIPYMSWGIYLDDYSSGTLVYGNIVARTDLGGICVHGGRDNVFENNIFVEGRRHQIRLQPRDDFMQGNRYLRNIIVYSQPDSELIYSWDSRSDRFSEWDYNCYFLRGNSLESLDRKITPVGTYEQWRKTGFDSNSIVSDPFFVNAKKDDYRLRSDSPALKLGFKQIPVEKIGAGYWRKKSAAD